MAVTQEKQNNVARFFTKIEKCVTNVTKLPWTIAIGRDNVTNVTKPL